MAEDPRKDWPAWICILGQLLIVYSVVTIALDTMPELDDWDHFFWISECIVVGIFTIEYFAAWLMSNNKLKYPLQPLAVIDFLAILPFYLSLGVDLRWMRCFRFIRIFRILKLARYNTAVRFLGQAFLRCYPQLVVFGMLVAISIVVSAMLLYYAEHDAQPEAFRSIPESLWWAVVTLTTVGYGDAAPVTFLGRLIASCVMIVGIGLVAVPTGIFSSTMSQMVQEAMDANQKDGKKPARMSQLLTSLQLPDDDSKTEDKK